jgi:hypothetical protein
VLVWLRKSVSGTTATALCATVPIPNLEEKMIDDDAARELLAVVDVSLASVSRHIDEMGQGDARDAVQRLFDAVTTHQLLLKGHIEDHPS